MIKKDIVETEIRTIGFQKLQQDILESYKKIDEYRDSIKRLQNEKQKLISAGKKESAEYKNITKEIALLNKAMDDEKKTRQSLMSGLKLTDMSYNQLKKRQTELRSELRATSESVAPEQYAKLRAELERVDQQMGKISTGLRQVSKDMIKAPGMWGNAMGKVKNYLPAIGIGSVISSGFSKLIGSISGSVGKFRQYDEALTDAMKTTGQSKEGITAISEELKKIDTRTSQNELLGLARVAGKLGRKTKASIQGFVEGADIVGVALAEDLGGNVEQAINEIGKLVDIFDLEKDFGIKDAIIRVGSAINEAGASSTANEGYIVDFSKRVAGIAPNADIAIDRVIGLAATLDKYGQQSETSSTVYGQTINKMFTDPAKHAKLAGMGVKEFTNLLKTDANAAFIALLKGLRGNDAAMMDIANNLDDMSVKGSRGIQVLGTLVKNVDELEAQQTLANKALADGTSAIDEFDKKNNSAQARREKRLNATHDAIVDIGEVLEPIYDAFLAGSATMMEVLSATIKILYQYKWVLLSLVGGYVLYNTAIKAWNAFKGIQIALSSRSALAMQKETYAMLAHSVATKAGTAAVGGYTIATKALAVAKALLTLNFRAAAVAAKAFFVALGPIGWVVSAITAVGTAIAFMASQTEELSASKVALKEIQTSAINSTRAEKNELERLLDVAEAKTTSDARRAQAIAELQQLMPNGIALINQETIANGKARKSVEQYCEALLIRAKIEGAKEYLVEYEKNRLEQMQDGSLDVKWWQKAWAVSKDLFTLQSFTGEKTSTEFANENRAEHEIDNFVVRTQITKYINKLETQESELNQNKSNVGDKCSKCGKSKAECVCNAGDGGGGDKSKKEWSLQNDKIYNEKKLALKEKLLKGEFDTENDYNQAVANLEIKTLEDRLKLTSLNGEERVKLEQELADKKYNQAKTNKVKEDRLQEAANGGKSETEQENGRYEKQLKELGLFGVKREDMTEKQLSAFEFLEKEHNKKLLNIRSNADKKTIGDIQTTNELEMSELRRKQAEELSLLTSASEIKQAKIRHKKEQQQLQYTQTESLLKLYQTQLAKVNEQGSALGKLMTKEDKQKMETIINDLIAKLKELGVEINETSKKETKSGVDIFGMTPDGWEELFANFGKGKDGLADWGDAIKAIGEAVGQSFAAVSDLMASIEERELKDYEKTQNKKKKALEKQLKSGAISQERYNEKVQGLDEQTDAKREEMERKQAERQKTMAIFNALISTAVAVTGALGAMPAGPWNIALAAIIGALGAVQVAAIIAQPLPGAEKGGLLVERTQDGARYNAEFEPQKRGRVDRPTVIVGENGAEYVVPADGYNNPTVRPILNMIERARTNGSLATIDLNAVMRTSTLQGRAGGGYIAPAPPTTSPQTPISPEEVVMLKTVLDKLSAQLDAPIEAHVTIAGERGVAKNLDTFNALKKRATING